MSNTVQALNKQSVNSVKNIISRDHPTNESEGTQGVICMKKPRGTISIGSDQIFDMIVRRGGWTS
jgi:hypothetical protein